MNLFLLIPSIVNGDLSLRNLQKYDFKATRYVRAWKCYCGALDCFKEEEEEED